MKKINKHKLLIILIALIVITILFFYFKDVLIKLLTYYIHEDYEGAKQLIMDKGLFGCFAIILVESLQMLVVFISAEFIQISAGLSYPWYIAVVLCDIGVFIGATLIFYLVRMTKFDSSIFQKSADKINSYSSKGKSTQYLMYFLFVMPIIPFGAICYYAANTKVTYKRYIFTCITGVLPSILTSIFLGRTITIAIKNDIPWWIIILSVIAVMLVLIIIGALIFKKTIINKNSKSPDSVFYKVLLKGYRFIVKQKVKVDIKDKNKLTLPDKPYIVLSNHPSPYDVYFATETLYPTRLAFVVNKYYLRNKIINYILKQIGIIPKKLFSPDIETIKKTIKTIKGGYPVYMCPEGRLGIDGTNYYITKETGKFIKQLRVPIVIMTFNGAYLSKPKWRKHRIKSYISTNITRIITQEEVLKMSVNEINDLINESIKYNDFDFALENNLQYVSKTKAEGLENVLYYCPKCHKEFSFKTKGNNITCSHCGFELHINNNYQFDDNEFNIKNIHEFYELIKEYEKEQLKNDNYTLSCDVKIKKFNFKNKKFNEKGIGKCTLNKNEFTYSGNLKVSNFTINLNTLKALAFSCGEEFECYYNDELYYFYPITNKQQCAKWAMIVDIINEGNDNYE